MNLALTPGDIFASKFRIDAVLGEGGFAVVYEATDLNLGRRVALKLLKADGADYSPVLRGRFARELKAVAKLRDPHTVTMFESGTTPDGALYVVFERVPGRDLAEILHESGPLPPAIVERVLRQLLASLREAHHAGVLHRDLKPENVRVFETKGDPWCVKLLDFGIARHLESDDPAITADGELIGTPRYMSPEQLTHKPLTPASDIYSLGMMAFEMLAGRDALQGGGWGDQLQRLRTGHLFAAPGLEAADRHIQDVVARMTARDPAQRLPNTEAVLRMLDTAETAATREYERPATGGDALPVRGAAPSAPRVSNRTLARSAGVAVLAAAALGIYTVALLLAPSDVAHPEPPPPHLSRHLIEVADPAPIVVIPDASTDLDEAPGGTKPRVVGSAGCGREPPFVGRGQLRFEHRLATDTWAAYVPQSYSRERPTALIVLLHDDRQTGADFLHHGGFEPVADESGFVVIAPDDGIIRPWRGTKSRRDLFDMQDETAAQLCIDPSRVFVVSQGAAGRGALMLSCADWVKGVAVNSYRGAKPYSRCDRAVPFLSLSPLHSAHQPIEGGRNCHGSMIYSVEEADRIWRTRNVCGPKNRRTYKRGSSECHRWSCDAPYESCVVDGGYNWPGVPTLADPQRCETAPPPKDFPIASRIWTFFSRIKQ